MRHASALALTLLLGITSSRAQLSWVPCTMPVNTLTLLAMGPYGELVTLLSTNPAQPRISTDQGQTWQDHPGTGGPNGTFLSDTRLHLTNAGTILIWGSANGGSTYNVWRSADGGDTFTQLGSGAGIPASRFFMGFTSGPNGDVYLYGEGILRSTNDGQSWTSIVGVNTTVDAAVANSTSLYAVHLTAVYRGGVDGSGFTAISTGVAQVGSGLGLARGMNERIIAVGGTDRVITTADDGNTWQVVNTGIGATPTELQHIAASLSSDTWVTGKQISVFYTDNGGAPWVTGTTGLALAPNEPIQGIFCDSTGTFYLYGYDHLYRSDISTGIAAPVRVDRGSAYPNPTAGTVQLPAAFAGQTCLLLDVAGREVMRLQAATDATLDVGQVQSGQYFLRTTDGMSTTSLHVVR